MCPFWNRRGEYERARRGLGPGPGAAGGVRPRPGGGAPGGAGGPVRTHWEALETRAGSLPDVETPWPGGIGEDLIPGEDYGPLYPYAGTVINAAEWGGGSPSL